MKKPIKQYQFRVIEGTWRDVIGDSREILANVLNELNIIIDDKCEFCRIKDYENERYIYYRVYGGKITIDIWKLD